MAGMKDAADYRLCCKWIKKSCTQAVHHKLGFYLLLYCAHLDQRPNVKVARVYLATKHVGDRPEVVSHFHCFYQRI